MCEYEYADFLTLVLLVENEERWRRDVDQAAVECHQYA